MLLRCVSSLAETEPRIGRSITALAELLIPYAQGDWLKASLFRDPGLALEDAAAYIQLSGLGYGDRCFDALLGEILREGEVGGPERVPNHQLEHQWLRRIWREDSANETELTALLSQTCIGRSLDVLGANVLDLYAFTHVILYATDMGQLQTVRWPRPVAEIVADAEAALAVALDADNFDLGVELLWTWPMLRLPWSAAATFGFGVAAAAQDAHGFLPGPAYSATDAEALSADQRESYILRTSYHSTFVMGFLCAAALRSGPAPPVIVTKSDADVDRLISPLVQRHSKDATWQDAFTHLDAAQQALLTGFVLSIVLRRARSHQDLQLIRDCMKVALQLDGPQGPAVHQALALLRRAVLISQLPVQDKA